MHATCLINNYNYRRFVGEAVDSALAQSHAFDEVIVVDDGSTDDSVAYLQRKYADEPRVKVIEKENGGQLSAFNEGVRHATGELVFFLDADDRYLPGYLEHALASYEQESMDFAIAGAECFGPKSGVPRKLWPRRDMGYSLLATTFSKVYIGGPTSTISMRREIAQQVLPYPAEADWRTRADDVLVLGASLAGARKFHLGVPLVEYRMHGGNNFSGRRANADAKLRHALAVNKLVHWYTQQAGYDREDLARMLHREFATIERPTLAEWQMYQGMSWRAKLPLVVRARHLGETTLHYWRERLATHEASAAPTAVHDAADDLAADEDTPVTLSLPTAKPEPHFGEQTPVRRAA